jgi:hypothetical protein
LTRGNNGTINRNITLESVYSMEIKSTNNKGVTLLEIQKDGNPVNSANPVQLSELASLKIPQDLGGKIVLVSGMPFWASATVLLAVKNLFTVVATVDPKFEGAIVIHSLDPNHPIGSVIPLG